MAYADIATIAESASLRRRIAACAAQEGKGNGAPAWWAETHMLRLAASGGWEAAWASAVASNVPDPGASEAVITDSMILAAVQPMT